MSDESALLAAILAHPDEDTPRLMYADWLQENGQPERAKLIRLQCVVDADDENAESEEGNLSRLFGAAPIVGVLAKLKAGVPPVLGAEWEFRRGFPEYLDAPGKLFLERYEAFAGVPWLRFLCLHELNNSTVRDFLNRQWNTQWVEVELQEDPLLATYTNSYSSTPAMLAIANCAQVLQLRRLRLSLFELTSDGIRALATSSNLDNLQRLLIDSTRDDQRFAPLRERFGDRLVIG